VKASGGPASRRTSRPWADSGTPGPHPTPNRRRDHPHVPVWEIHPVLRLCVFREGDRYGTALNGRTGVEKHEEVASHELAEAVTDPGAVPVPASARPGGKGWKTVPK
jgi:hypothetical protein